jgi:hypothetical protein
MRGAIQQPDDLRDLSETRNAGAVDDNDGPQKKTERSVPQRSAKNTARFSESC